MLFKKLFYYSIYNWSIVYSSSISSSVDNHESIHHDMIRLDRSKSNPLPKTQQLNLIGENKPKSSSSDIASSVSNIDTNIVINEGNQGIFTEETNQTNNRRLSDKDTRQVGLVLLESLCHNMKSPDNVEDFSRCLKYSKYIKNIDTNDVIEWFNIILRVLEGHAQIEENDEVSSDTTHPASVEGRITETNNYQFLTNLPNSIDLRRIIANARQTIRQLGSNERQSLTREIKLGIATAVRHGMGVLNSIENIECDTYGVLFYSFFRNIQHNEDPTIYAIVSSMIDYLESIDISSTPLEILERLYYLLPNEEIAIFDPESFKKEIQVFLKHLRMIQNRCSIISQWTRLNRQSHPNLFRRPLDYMVINENNAMNREDIPLNELEILDEMPALRRQGAVRPVRHIRPVEFPNNNIRENRIQYYGRFVVNAIAFIFSMWVLFSMVHFV